jgi:hypothetical protein
MASSNYNRDSRQQGESSRSSLKARVPILASLGPDPSHARPLKYMIDEYNNQRRFEDRIRIPLCNVGNTNERPRPICFRFCSSNGPGCNSRYPCHFHHLDLSDPDWFRKNVPKQFCHDLRRFLGHSAIRQHYSATPEFQSFLGSL